MKNKNNLTFFIIELLTVKFFSQTYQQRKQITKNYNLMILEKLTQEAEKKFQRERQQALDYAKIHDLPLIIHGENGEVSQLHRMNPDGKIEYIKTFGVADGKAIGTDKLYPGGGMGLELEGEGMKIGIWDAGAVRTSHELLSGKTVQMDQGEGPSPDHATHVTGIAAGKKLTSGPGAQARGMAYKADIDAYDWNSDIPEMTAAASQGLLVSNHSYGLDLSKFPNSFHTFLGAYDDVSMLVDTRTFNAPYYTVVTAAGNDRNTQFDINQGYNLLSGWFATAKNTIVVAAVDVTGFYGYTGPSSVNMSSFSSWGPTNDHRVKPDIAAQGVGVYSSTATSNNSYSGNYNGTSMAAPGVAGSLLLLQELSADLNGGNFLKSATLKAIMIQTALPTENTPGPNPRTGWGLFNSEGAAQLMLDNHQGENAYYDELTLTSGEPFTLKVKANSEGELKATIAWTDRAGVGLNNDLDMRITNSQGNTFYPWRLNPADYAAPALNNGDNSVDNVEQVLVQNAVPGEEYTITVTHKGNLTSGKQDFGIAVTGIQSTPMSVDKYELTGVSLYPNPADNKIFIELETSESVEIEIFDLNGRKVKEGKTTAFSNEIDISDLNSGVYFVKINSEGKTKTKKLIVK